MSVVEIKNLTKDYGSGRGIFNINLSIEEGEMVGFVGTNGSGKTTTLRSILGFIKPTKGCVEVNGLESWKNSSQICSRIGYVPGEIAFPDLKSGTSFLKCQAEFLHLKDMSKANELIEKLQLDPRANLKRMSKGMKQKTALVEALMNDNPIILLDEPTTGLDPLMRDAFLEIIKDEHKKGKTVLMSSHLFNEMEDTCDRVVLISNGYIVAIADMHEIKNRTVRDFKIEFENEKEYERFLQEDFTFTRYQEKYNQVTISIDKKDINKLFSILKKYKVKFLSEVKFTLEKYFKDIMFKKKGE